MMYINPAVPLLTLLTPLQTLLTGRIAGSTVLVDAGRFIRDGGMS